MCFEFRFSYAVKLGRLEVEVETERASLFYNLTTFVSLNFFVGIIVLFTDILDSSLILPILIILIFIGDQF